MELANAIHGLLPIRSMVVTLECLAPSRPAFFHHAALTAFLRELAGSPADYGTHIRIDAPETGHPGYLPGDFYRFTLIGLGGAEALLDRLIARLQRLPRSAPRNDGAALPFRDNWRLVDLRDSFTARPVGCAAELSCWGRDELVAEAALWNEHDNLHWRWLSPARLLKDKTQRKNLRNEERYCHDARDITPELLLNRLHDHIANLLRQREATAPPRAEPPQMAIPYAHQFWLDFDYRGRDGKAKPMGGITGVMRLRTPPDFPPGWRQLLALGQYTGMGQRATDGWGRYQLATADGGVSCRRPLRAVSLLTVAQRKEILTEAWRHILSGADQPAEMAPDEALLWQPDDDLEDDDEPPGAPLEELRDQLDQIQRGDYRFPELHGHLIPKSDGGWRALAIPPARDRVLQRAVAQTLAPALDRLMYPHSHGYRRGHSRQRARDEIQAAWRAGYRWVYESDIRDFFDSVDWRRLRERLLSLYGDDPVTAAILGWMQAPIRFRGERIPRRRGLPQGSPLSPLMANLILDDFDSDMADAGFRLVRFADDFVVLCKNPEQARAAGEAAERSLAEHGLALHPDKTAIHPMSDGFKFLGYLFLNDMAVDLSARKKADNDDQPAPTEPAEHPWLLRLANKKPQPVRPDDPLDALLHRIRHGGRTTIGERGDEGALLTVTGQPARLTTLNRQARVLRDDKVIAAIPWRNLETVILFGNHQVTTQAMHAALREDVPIHLASGSGRYRGVVTTAHPSQGHRLWLAQAALFDDPKRVLACATEVVQARLIHMKETLRLRKLARNTPQIDNALRHIHQHRDIDSLRGSEGIATREYYERLATLLPPELEFTSRNRRPPRDPFNVLLSLGYTVLYGYSESILHGIGLLPRAGFYHQPRGTHAALASDLMEPFRHIVERTALTLVLRGQIDASDFTTSDDGACRIDNNARRK